MMKSNLVLLLVGGLLVGLFAGVLGGWLLLNLLEATETAEPLPALPPYDIEIIVEETYINRMMLEGSSALVGGNVDLQPGGAATFAVQLAVGPFKPVVRGDAAFRMGGAGRLTVQLLRVKMGRLSLLRLIPRRAVAGIDDLVNDALVERVGSKGLEVVAVSSDESTLRLYLAQRE